MLYTLYYKKKEKKIISVAKKFRVGPLFVSHTDNVICHANDN